MDFKKLFILILSVLFFSPSYSAAMDKTSSNSKTNANGKFDPNGMCSICLCKFGKNSESIRQLICSHFFHSECIQEWIDNKHDKCPLCRRDMDPCLQCQKSFDPNDQAAERKKVKTPCGHIFHLNCLIQNKDIGWYECCFCIGDRKCYYWLKREDQCPICDEYLTSKFLKENNIWNHSDSEDDSYDDE